MMRSYSRLNTPNFKRAVSLFRPFESGLRPAFGSEQAGCVLALKHIAVILAPVSRLADSFFPTFGLEQLPRHARR